MATYTTTNLAGGLSLVTHDGDDGEFHEVRMEGFHFPLASFDEIEQAEKMIGDDLKVSKAKGDMVLWVTENYTAADIVKYSLIPVCTNRPPIGPKGA